MSLFASMRNAVRWAGFDLGRQDGAAAQAVVLVNPETGSAFKSGSGISTEPLGVPTVARQLAVTVASASVQLTAGCRRVSIKARGTDMRYVVGVGEQTANASTSHYIESGERLDIAVPAGATIAAIRESASSTNGSLAITELG